MHTTLPSVPESCTQCPYIDPFHGTCAHPLRQDIIQELEGDRDVCPMFSDIRNEAMADLEERLGDE